MGPPPPAVGTTGARQCNWRREISKQMACRTARRSRFGDAGLARGAQQVVDDRDDVDRPARRSARRAPRGGPAARGGRAAPAAAARRRRSRSCGALGLAAVQPEPGRDRAEHERRGACEQARRHARRLPSVPDGFRPRRQGRAGNRRIARDRLRDRRGAGRRGRLRGRQLALARSASRRPPREIGARPYVHDSADLDAAPGSDRRAWRPTSVRWPCWSPTPAARRAASRSSSPASSGRRPTASWCWRRWR